MNEAAEQALANFQHEQALSIAHAKRAEGYLAQFLKIVSQKDGSRTPSGQTIKCVREWTRWLAENGPATRAHITEATGVRFSERGTAHTFMWDDDMVSRPDDSLPANAIMRIRGKQNDGRGAPPVIFFLWSQRYDVHPLFGVGPTPLDGFIPVTAEPVIRDLTVTLDEGAPGSSITVVPSPPERYSTIEEWDDAYGSLFDSLVATDSKPTDEQKSLLRETLPIGQDANAAIAIAHRNAVMRSREPQTLLGVVHPPVSAFPIDPDHGDEQPIDWDSA